MGLVLVAAPLVVARPRVAVTKAGGNVAGNHIFGEIDGMLLI